jgi:HAMP domain-containing protein
MAGMDIVQKSTDLANRIDRRITILKDLKRQSNSKEVKDRADREIEKLQKEFKQSLNMTLGIKKSAFMLRKEKYMTDLTKKKGEVYEIEARIKRLEQYIIDLEDQNTKDTIRINKLASEADDVDMKIRI